MVELALAHGFGNVTVDDIAERADVTRATFYKHYARKEELLADVAQRFADDVIASFADRPTGTSRMVPLFESARRSPEVCRVILSGEGDGVALRRFSAILEQIIRDDIESGRLGASLADLDHELLIGTRAAHVLAAVSWFIDHDADAEQTARDVTRVLESGWGPPAGPSPR